MDVTGVVISEGTRVFAGVFAGDSIVISGQSLSLTDSHVLPEVDANGFFDPSGGYLSFDEVSHNADGDLVSEREARKVYKQFTEGSISGFSFERTKDSPSGGYVFDRQATGFSVDSNIAYQATSWNQQEGWKEVNGVRQDDVYAYQSNPMWKATLESGGSVDYALVSADNIVSSQGWDLTSETHLTANLRGTLTMYRPKRSTVAANSDPELEQEVNTVDSGVFTTETTRSTDVSDWENIVGDDGELVEKVVLTETSVDVTTVDTSIGQATENTTTVHSTWRYSYSVRQGFTSAAIRNRSLEKVAAHEVTTKTEDSFTASYNSDGSFTRTDTSTTLRYTDNPATRNDIDSWRSTRSVMTTVYTASTNTTVTDVGGTEWLTEHIEADTDVNTMAFAISGSIDTTSDLEARFFGANSSGVEWVQTDTETRNVTNEWGGDVVQVSGSYTNHQAEISVGNVVHPNQGDWDGAVSVTLNGESFSVSAEEFLNALRP